MILGDAASNASLASATSAAILGLVAIWRSSRADTKASEVDERTVSVQEFQAMLQAQQEMNRRLAEQNVDLDKRLKGANHRIGQLREEVAGCHADRHKQEAENATLKEDIDRLRAEVLALKGS